MAPDADSRFAESLAMFGPALRRLAQAYATDAADAEDLFQEICFAVWRALPTFRAESSLRTFVFRIGHNRGLTHRSRPSPTTVDLDAGIPDHAPGPERILGARLRREQLLAAVRRLPEIQREVVTMSLEGLTPSEIAEVIGSTANGVAVRLTRARKALKEILTNDGGRSDRTS